MSKVKIISDSTCDLSEELLAQFDVAVLPHPIVRDGELLQDNVTITPDDIYRHYEQTGRLCTTSAPNTYDYEMCWKPWLDEGYEIVHFTISSEMSTAYNQAMLAAEETGHVYRWIQELFQPVSVCLYWKPVICGNRGYQRRKLWQKCVRTQINARPVSLWMS